MPDGSCRPVPVLRKKCGAYSCNKESGWEAAALRERGNMIRALQLPDDTRRGRALVRMEGQEHVCIENFKGICSYTAEAVSLTTAGNPICVSGQHLRIDCYTRDAIEISGWIEAVKYI